MGWRILVAAVLLVAPLEAQVQGPFRYQLRRLTVLDASAPYPWRENMLVTLDIGSDLLTCNLEPGPITVPGFRVADPVNAGRECEWAAPSEAINSGILATSPSVLYTWALAQQLTEDHWWSVEAPGGHDPDDPDDRAHPLIGPVDDPDARMLEMWRAWLVRYEAERRRACVRAWRREQMLEMWARRRAEA